MYIPNPADEVQASRFGALFADEAEYDDSYRVIRPGGRTDWLMTLTLSGTGLYRLRGQGFLVKSGDIALLKPGTPQDYGTLAGTRWHFYWAHFVPTHNELNSLMLPQPETGLGHYHIDDDGMLQRLLTAFRRLIADNHNRSVYNNLLAHNALDEILLLIAHTLTSHYRLDPRIQVTLAYIGSHLNEPITVEQLAGLVSLSPSRFSHLFTAQVGQSPIRYTIELRLHHAARLLAYSDHPVQAIATLVGFESPFHFSHQFKQRYGLSPARYRQKQFAPPTVPG